MARKIRNGQEIRFTDEDGQTQTGRFIGFAGDEDQDLQLVVSGKTTFITRDQVQAD